jgi:putative FmdB family regulatory protein
MPIYEYKCAECGSTVEAIQKVADRPLKTCSRCGGTLEKLVSSPAIQFKGSGWYITDYANKSAAAGKSKDEPGTKKPAKTTETKEKKESAPTEKSQASSPSG